MTNGNDETRTRIGVSEGTDNTARKQAEETLLKAGALQSAIFKAPFSVSPLPTTGLGSQSGAHPVVPTRRPTADLAHGAYRSEGGSPAWACRARGRAGPIAPHQNDRPSGREALVL